MEMPLRGWETTCTCAVHLHQVRATVACSPGPFSPSTMHPHVRAAKGEHRPPALLYSGAAAPRGWDVSTAINFGKRQSLDIMWCLLIHSDSMVLPKGGVSLVTQWEAVGYLSLCTRSLDKVQSGSDTPLQGEPRSLPTFHSLF